MRLFTLVQAIAHLVERWVRHQKNVDNRTRNALLGPCAQRLFAIGSTTLRQISAITTPGKVLTAMWLLWYAWYGIVIRTTKN